MEEEEVQEEDVFQFGEGSAGRAWRQTVKQHWVKLQYRWNKDAAASKRNDRDGDLASES